MHLRIILVGLFLALMFLHFGVHSYHDVSRSLKSSSSGWGLSPVNGRVRLTQGMSTADTSLLRDDDEIIAQKGRVRRGHTLSQAHTSVHRAQPPSGRT